MSKIFYGSLVACGAFLLYAHWFPNSLETRSIQLSEAVETVENDALMNEWKGHVDGVLDRVRGKMTDLRNRKIKVAIERRQIEMKRDELNQKLQSHVQSENVGQTSELRKSLERFDRMIGQFDELLLSIDASGQKLEKVISDIKDRKMMMESRDNFTEAMTSLQILAGSDLLAGDEYSEDMKKIALIDELIEKKAIESEILYGGSANVILSPGGRDRWER